MGIPFKFNFLENKLTDEPHLDICIFCQKFVTTMKNTFVKW